MSMYYSGSHSIYTIKYHFVWITKYRYKILQGKIAERMRILLIQGCEAKGIRIISGSIGKEHIHMLLACPPKYSPSQIVKYLKGRSSHLIQDEFPELKKRYWGQHLWARGYFCGTVGEVDTETIKKYVETQGRSEEMSFNIVKH